MSASKATSKSNRRQAAAIIQKLSPDSSARTLQALSNVRLAQRTTNKETQLILLWSAIENLLSDVPDKMVRIHYFLDSMVPAICLNYARRYSCAIYDEFCAHHKNKTRGILKYVEHTDKDDHTRFIRFMFDPTHSLARNALLSNLDDNPLLRNRLWKLFENFGEVESLHRSTDSYEKRVEWQISRIYRARNSLMHGGQKPRYISPLVMNAYEYFKIVYFTIAYRAELSTDSMDTEYILSSVIFDFESRKSEIELMRKEEKRGPLDIDRYLAVFDKV